MRLLRAVAFLCLFTAAAFSQTTTTVTGTIKDLTGTAVTSGQVTFSLKPGLDTTISGAARFIPSTVTCSLTGAGLVKALDGVSACTLVNNTALTPAGTSYQACIQAAFIAPGSCFNMYALGGTLDITTVVPTRTTSPAFTYVDLFSAQTVSGDKTFTGSTTFTGNLTFGSLTATTIKADTVQQKSSGTAFVINDAQGISHFFLAAANPAVNTFVQGNGAGVVFLGSAAKMSVADTTGNITADGSLSLFTISHTLGNSLANDTAGGFSITSNAGHVLQWSNNGTLFFGNSSDKGNTFAMFGATSGSTVVQPSGVASGVLTLPAVTATLASLANTLGDFAATTSAQLRGTLSDETGTGVAVFGTAPTISAPVINGTPSGTGIPTVTLKTGTGGGNYTTSSTSLVRVDATNLAYTVTIPTGWKLMVNASGVVSSATGPGGVNIALADGSADNTGILVLVLDVPAISGTGSFNAWTLNWVVNGDGASHTINLQFSTGNASDAAIMVNNTSTQKPMMTFMLTPSN